MFDGRFLLYVIVLVVLFIVNRWADKKRRERHE